MAARTPDSIFTRPAHFAPGITEREKMKAFCNPKYTRDALLERIRAHRAADELVQSYCYWSAGKGCALGCSVHTGDMPHVIYESRYGVPESLAHLQDSIFEGLPAAEAMAWPERFVLAITPGADLSRVWHQWSAWLLSDSGLLTISPQNRREIAAIAALHRRCAAGEVVKLAEWVSCAGAAWSLAWSSEAGASEAARVAAAEVLPSGSAAARASAAAMAQPAVAARVAARVAAWSSGAAAARAAHELAWSSGAAWSSSAWSAAWASGAAEAWRKMADKLVELLAAAK